MISNPTNISYPVLNKNFEMRSALDTVLQQKNHFGENQHEKPHNEGESVISTLMSKKHGQDGLSDHGGTQTINSQLIALEQINYQVLSIRQNQFLIEKNQYWQKQKVKRMIRSFESLKTKVDGFSQITTDFNQRLMQLQI